MTIRLGGEAFRRHGSQMLLGTVWAGGMAWLDLRFLWWLSPIVFSLILSPFVSVLSSRATLGMKSKRAKLFLIPEEYNPPRELLATEEYLHLNRNRALTNGFMHAVVNRPSTRWRRRWRRRVTICVLPSIATARSG